MHNLNIAVQRPPSRRLITVGTMVPLTCGPKVWHLRPVDAWNPARREVVRSYDGSGSFFLIRSCSCFRQTPRQRPFVHCILHTRYSLLTRSKSLTDATHTLPPSLSTAFLNLSVLQFSTSPPSPPYLAPRPTTIPFTIIVNYAH
jgi:hypothetical protein